MKDGIERRRHIRAPFALPVVLETTQGIINGKTTNISISGLALVIFFEKLPTLSDIFQITLKLPDNNEISVFCEKVWSGNIVDNDSVYNAIGVQFIKMSSHDRKVLTAMIKNYYLT